jgi:phosphohistidine phosphatase
MRLLTLVRHAKSSWDNPSQSDFDRPLNARGERVAPEMAQRMAETLEPPLLLISSPALRARSTAEIFARALGIRAEDIRLDSRIYDATPGTLLDVLHGLEDTVSHAVLFGHNPGLSDLLRLLTQSATRDLPTCAVATVNLDGKRWSDIEPGDGRLQRFHYPKEMGI